MPHDPPAVPPPSAAVVELLAWIAARPRTYAETMEAWRTSCPRLSTWEDASLGGLVELSSSHDGGASASIVSLTSSGRAILDEMVERATRAR
jgi:hypothetical protein